MMKIPTTGLAEFITSEEVSPEEASRLIRCSRPHVYKLIGQGVLRARLVGTHQRLNKQEVLQYIERDKVSRREALMNLAKFDQGEEIIEPCLAAAASAVTGQTNES